MPARLRPGDPRQVAAALARFRDGTASPEDVRTLSKHYLALLVAAAPGKAVELRVPPVAAVQCVAGARHTRGTPPAVVETDPATWVALAAGDLTWDEAVTQQQVTASGAHSDLSALLPLDRP